MSDETTLLREKLNKLIIEIERLDIKLDSPAYDMTLGEYEQEREKLLDEFEQAIAATLGSGTLTAEQVREAIERNFGKVAVLDDGEPVEWRDDWVCKVGINYKAIADELNARAERTCHNTHENRWFKCSACGYGFTDLYAEDEGDIDEQPRYCPNCGCKVVGE